MIANVKARECFDDDSMTVEEAMEWKITLHVVYGSAGRRMRSQQERE